MDNLREFGFLLKDVSRLYVQRFEERAKTLGLTLSQCKVLVYLARNEGISQVRLGALTEIEPMSLVRILDQMEAQGWLERRADPADRRARCLFLKPKAKPVEDGIWSVSDVTRSEAFAGIARQHAKLLIEMFEKIRANILALPTVPVPHETVVATPAEAVLRVRPAASRSRRSRPAVRP